MLFIVLDFKLNFNQYPVNFQVCTSRFWFNYRHVANVLSIYRSVKRLGIPDRYDMKVYIYRNLLFPFCHLIGFHLGGPDISKHTVNVRGLKLGNFAIFNMLFPFLVFVKS